MDANESVEKVETLIVVGGQVRLTMGVAPSFY